MTKLEEELLSALKLAVLRLDTLDSEGTGKCEITRNIRSLIKKLDPAWFANYDPLIPG